MKIIKSNIPWLLVLVVLITSCEKTEINYEPNRQTIVKIKDAETELNVKAKDVLPNVEEFELIRLRRDPTRESDLNQSLTVKLVKDPSIIADYNTANGTSFEELPSSLYTLLTDINNITFAPGEFAQSVNIRLDKTNLDLSKQYALAFRISEVGSGAVISNAYKQAIYSIGVKNKYDGTYEITWTNYHPTLNPGYTGATIEVEMHTSGPSSVKIYMPDFGGYYAPALLGGSITAFGAQEPQYTVNEATGAVTVQNSFPGAVTFYTMAAGYNSRYDVPSKTFDVKWGYNYSGGAFDPANTREWTQMIKYLGPR